MGISYCSERVFFFWSSGSHYFLSLLFFLSFFFQLITQQRARERRRGEERRGRPRLRGSSRGHLSSPHLPSSIALVSLSKTSPLYSLFLFLYPSTLHICSSCPRSPRRPTNLGSLWMTAAPTYRFIPTALVLAAQSSTQSLLHFFCFFHSKQEKHRNEFRLQFFFFFL